ncbi:hypothetical protein QSV34_03345 [Porticoccus sp. W117]|uniref:hypothetical protein n=1 Tax=Porticoccus sp. W117 TaxID=3054777 RepID=UPI002591FCC7|nr:hypothetical protein [Porticoccus sp. W117]MDM3870385.1 hypothetical protein [Porticoccus sp. W117]
MISRPIIAFLFTCFNAQADNHCAPFQWVTDTDGSEKSAMVVRTTINGKTADMQFDTGSDVSVFYGSEPATALGIALAKQPSGSITGMAPLAIGDMDFASQTFHVMPYPPASVAGRIGLRSLLGHIVQIDYPGQQICLLSKAQYHLSRNQIRQVPAQIRSSKLFLTTELDGHKAQRFFFDTGASLFDLLLDKAQWQKLTDRHGDEESNSRIEGWANDQLVTTIGAPLNVTLKIGDIDIHNAQAHYTRERPNYFANLPLEADGLLGNSLFFDKKVILDLRQKRTWFGVFKD